MRETACAGQSQRAFLKIICATTGPTTLLKAQTDLHGPEWGCPGREDVGFLVEAELLGRDQRKKEWAQEEGDGGGETYRDVVINSREGCLCHFRPQWA